LNELLQQNALNTLSYSVLHAAIESAAERRCSWHLHRQNGKHSRRL